MSTNEAIVLSVDADVAPDTVRVSLQWQGDHDISDFDLQRFGKVLRIQDQTENTGWAIIERRFHARIAHTLPGWPIHESVCPLTAEIPYRCDQISNSGSTNGWKPVILPENSTLEVMQRLG